MKASLETKRALRPVLDHLREADDVDAIIVGLELYEALLEAQADVAAIRRSAIRNLRAQGYTLREIADMVGLKPQRIHQMEQGYGRAEKRARAAT